MNKKQWFCSSVLTLSLLTTIVIAQQVGESVTIDQPQFSDQYLAGRIVQVTAPIQIPVLGTIVVFLVLFIGIGAMSAEFWQRYRQPA